MKVAENIVCTSKDLDSWSFMIFRERNSQPAAKNSIQVEPIPMKSITAPLTLEHKRPIPTPIPSSEPTSKKSLTADMADYWNMSS
mmetsp:Transcript_5307/g.12449  ORF Transcript_5307/g.12449 Transcript_5307/m.12449 type:complete len:85 (-) Transcript_5307:121-375(-)